jgi:uncharacterized protein YajQ (UPF0234 family)
MNEKPMMDVELTYSNIYKKIRTPQSDASILVLTKCVTDEIRLLTDSIDKLTEVVSNVRNAKSVNKKVGDTQPL